MVRARFWPFVGLFMVSPAFWQAAWSDTVSDSLTPDSVYLCHFGSTVSAYNFTQEADGHWEGMGSLEGWNIISQDTGLVARNADQLLIIGEGMDSLVQGDQVVQGQCAEANDALPQLFESDGAGIVTSPSTGPSDGDPLLPGLSIAQDEALLAQNFPEMSDIWVAGILSIINPGAWDAEKATALVEALALDDAVKMSLMAELRAVGRDPIRIARISRQIQRVIGLTAAATEEVRADLQRTRRDLAVVTRAFEEQRQRAEEVSRLLATAKAKATAAEKANSQTTARLETAQRALREKDAALGRSAHDVAVLSKQLATQRADLATLQGALNAAIDQQQDTNLEVVALIQELEETRARLARANKRIEELRGGRD